MVYTVYTVGLDIKILAIMKSDSQVWFVFSWCCLMKVYSIAIKNPSVKPPYQSSFAMNHKKRLERYLHLVWQKKNSHSRWRITVGSHILFLCIEENKHINSQVIHMASIGIRFAIREWSIMRKSPLII